ncbi:2-polyprenyl-6-methoxyphenol hydroxylase-like FAD-dependent oxidoreductase [Caulobacter ginsengisoli]|uniref:2-polyprenyl-6-methoxyphenol hydroxylase-like FAD-dependent oxidoreductase n=1 Tax=Caulobacter ginsengisoli TaxID=400775 RepID=A0ABU0ITC8_9CAUL|nr:FAD-dependent oxidoreductase [Caulobacter ginsengisoli]MDQ0465262.1 2-polyprenyl-6-methoxyphenol hydroxylase-like FAD-dependent oxidoreductase [Caulobacter ginsengisoli]
MTAAASQSVLVVGAGMAGLFTALALGKAGHRVTILERDPPAPEGGADEAFETWNRRGVGHLRHSHAFLARLREILVAEHPDLLQELVEAGVRELKFAEGLPLSSRYLYKPQPGDDALTILTSRRTTLELVIRRHVQVMAGVEIRSGVNVTGLLGEKDAQGRFVCTGLKTDQGDMAADIVVDGAGRTTDLFDHLAEMGIKAPEEEEDAGILYYTRHWRLRPGQVQPERGKASAAGDLGFIKFGVFPGDNGCFSVTLAVPEIELTLRQAVLKPEVFDRICALLPGVAPWTAPDKSEPISKVFGMGDLKSRWRDTAPNDQPLALNLFAAGDGLVRTNPLYGRGCSFAAVEGQLLAKALASSSDPVARAVAYQKSVNDQLRPFYIQMRDQDRSAIRRAKHALNPDYQPKLKARLIKSFAEDGVGVALRSDPDLMRQFMRGFHMLEASDAWIKRPANLAKVVRVWSRGKTKNAAFYPARLGPDRSALFADLQLPVRADAERLGIA